MRKTAFRRHHRCRSLPLPHAEAVLRVIGDRAVAVIQHVPGGIVGKATEPVSCGLLHSPDCLLLRFDPGLHCLVRVESSIAHATRRELHRMRDRSRCGLLIDVWRYLQ